MRKWLWSVMVVALMAMGGAPALAECTACPSAPCIPAECPPEETGMMGTVTINGQEYAYNTQNAPVPGIAGAVLDLGAQWELEDQNGDQVSELAFELDVENLPMGTTVTAKLQRYEKQGQDWIFVDDQWVETILFVPDSASHPETEGECNYYYDNWTNCGSGQAQCSTSASCSSATWCDGICLVASGGCFHPTWTQSCSCNANPPQCGGWEDQTVYWRAKCNTWGLHKTYQCRLAYIVEIQETM